MEKNKNLWIGVLAAAALLVLFSSLGMGGYSMMGFGMGFGFLFMILFWGAIIWLIFSLINVAQSDKKDEEDALTILKKRYASGEISKKQYEEMKKEINR